MDDEGASRVEEAAEEWDFVGDEAAEGEDWEVVEVAEGEDFEEVEEVGEAGLEEVEAADSGGCRQKKVLVHHTGVRRGGRVWAMFVLHDGVSHQSIDTNMVICRQSLTK